MKKIVHPGVKEFHGNCAACGCRFTYEGSDVIVDYAHGGRRVTCPDCGHTIAHFGASGTMWPMRGDWYKTKTCDA